MRWHVRGELILVVDDDADIREALCSILEDENYRVASAADGREALDVAAEERPSLILLDIMMPVMSGTEFRAAQLADDALRDVPVVILSADARCIDVGRLLGAAATLSKPFEPSALLDAMKGVLTNRGRSALALTA